MDQLRAIAEKIWKLATEAKIAGDPHFWVYLSKSDKHCYVGMAFLPPSGDEFIAWMGLTGSPTKYHALDKTLQDHFYPDFDSMVLDLVPVAMEGININIESANGL